MADLVNMVQQVYLYITGTFDGYPDKPTAKDPAYSQRSIGKENFNTKLFLSNRK